MVMQTSIMEPPSISQQRRAASSVATVDSAWQSLYRVGGAAALLVGVLFLIEMIVYIASSAPSLTDAAGWFSLLQNNRLVGLVDFGILELYGLVLFVPLFLALYAALR